MNYWELIQTEKSWSWSVVAIVSFMLALFVRHLILRNIFIKLKHMPRELKKNVEHNYVKRSIVGWFFFMLPIFLITLLWIDPTQLTQFFPLLYWQLIIIILFGISFLIHIQVYVNALFKLIEEKMSSEKEI